MATGTDQESAVDTAYRKGQGSYDSASLENQESARPTPADTSSVDEREKAGSWTNKTKGSTQQKAAGTFKFLKKKGPLAALTAVLLGGGGMLMLLTPGLAVVQLQEVLTGDLDDLTSVLDKRTDKLMKARMKKAKVGTVGLCAGKVSVKCKFSSMSDRQIKKLKKAGIQIECENGCVNKFRNHPSKLTFSDGTVITDPNKFSSAVRGNPTVARDMNRAFNPKYHGMASTAAAKGYKLLGLGKAKVIFGNTKDKIKENLNKAMNRKKLNSIDGAETTQSKDGKGNPIEKVGNTELDPSQQKANSGVKDKVAELRSKIASTKGFGGAIKGAGIVGTADTACTIYQTSRAFSLIAKTIRNQKMIAYAMALLNVASSIRAGEADADAVSFVGETLTKQDMREFIGESDSVDGEGNAVEPQKIKNPAYKQSAYDSKLYKLAANNDVPNVAAMSSSLSDFTAGGPGAGVLASVYENSKKAIGGDPKQVCGIVQNNFVRGGSLIIGVIGVTTGVGALRLLAGAVGGMAVANIAMGYLESAIVGESEDVNIDDYINNGSDAFAASWVGYSGASGQIASATGLTPVTNESLASYLDDRYESTQKHLALETEAAKDTPFDVMNQYSFLGSFARSAASAVRGSSNTISGLAAIVGTAFSTNTVAKAANTPNPDRFKQCKDADYEELGIAADVMCNVRYGFTPEQLNMESDEVADWMIRNDYVSDDAPETAELEQLAKPGAYQDFLTNCAYRTTPYGEQGEEQEDEWSTGAACLRPTSKLTQEQLDNFKVFTADYTLAQSMDYDPPSIGGGEESVTPGSGEMVDDYPYKGKTTADGFSPLRYAYGNCVDFVAWRINRDAGVTSEPWKYDWANLTPLGGNGADWAIEGNLVGWKTVTTPSVGDVLVYTNGAKGASAEFGHVSYIAQVNADGSVVVEQYNAIPYAYDTQVITAAELSGGIGLIIKHKES